MLSCTKELQWSEFSLLSGKLLLAYENKKATGNSNGSPHNSKQILYNVKPKANGVKAGPFPLENNSLKLYWAKTSTP